MGLFCFALVFTSIRGNQWGVDSGFPKVVFQANKPVFAVNWISRICPRLTSAPLIDSI